MLKNQFISSILPQKIDTIDKYDQVHCIRLFLSRTQMDVRSTSGSISSFMAPELIHEPCLRKDHISLY